MKFFALSLLFASSAMAGQILFCNQQDCGGSCSFQSPAGNGACIQLGGISSAKATQVDSGCSFGLDSCVAAPILGSYSYDC
ncbi:uncharacterized protein TRIREDRAFT_112037 [Trichoderma reesei QM6a]|uniref:Predicted protein n=2 Tax=Hypocrea jecorina TaxID=51453 RepID=G0RW15_HYPJQ|nr:uncharacterized protein TRIREDRAFT_112037 [Trichoderma reesei QM6a]EGR44659.1 predicted protein [Trichoderma reesei QM6a]ETR97415.1 hypothetical protein M419DRAFT_134436 [Trichoderma reesei RUT C-30]